MKQNDKWFWITLIFLLVAAGLFYIIVWHAAPVMEPDSATYMQVAVDLQDLKIDHIYGRTPGYPLFLLMTGSSENPQRMVFYFQIILYEAIVFLMAIFLSQLGLSKRVLALFAVLALLPYNFVHTAYVLTETLTIFFLLGGFLALLFWFQGKHWSLLLLSGSALAISAIVKPTYQLISVIFSIVFIFLAFFLPAYRKRFIQAAVALLATAALFLGGLILHNQQRLGFSGLTPDFGLYLSTKTPRVLERLPDEYREVRDILIKHRDERLLSVEYSHTGYMYLWGALPEIQEATHLKYPELSSYMMELNLLLIRKAPLTYLQEVTYSISNLWLPSTTALSDFNSRAIQFVWTALHYLTAVLFILVSIFVAGLVMVLASFPGKLLKKMMLQMSGDDVLRLVFILCGMLMVYYTIAISAMSDMGVARHRVPVDLVIFALIFVCFDLWNRLRGMIFKKELKFSQLLHRGE